MELKAESFAIKQMKSLCAQPPLPEKRHTKQQAVQFLPSACITTPFSTLGFIVQLILQMKEIITNCEPEERKRSREKGTLTEMKGKNMSQLCPAL
jgi:hypothetical protein